MQRIPIIGGLLFKLKNYEKAIEFVFLCKKQLILNSGITS